MPNYSTATDIVNTAFQELGLGVVNLRAAAADASGYQALGLLNSLGDELLRVHDWQNLEKVMNFVGDGVSESFPLPSNYGRQINQTEWATSDNRPLQGPVSPQVWSWNKYGIVAPGVYFQYRILDNEYAIYPTPGLDENFALYYISKDWVQDADDQFLFKSKITKENDVPQFDRRLMIAGLKNKLWAAKGLDTTTLASEFNYLLNSEKAQVQGARVINLAMTSASPLIGWGNVPDGNTYGN